MAEKKDIIKKEEPIQEQVLKRINGMQKGGTLELPPNYSAGNAINSAYLVLQETLTKDKKPVLAACTKASIANALLSMVIQGLSPDKTQCYFIAYGNQLQMQRSYFGAMVVAKRVDSNVLDFRAQPIYQGDVVKTELSNGKMYVISHASEFGNVNKDNIIGAYCTVIQADGDNYSELMTMDEIKASWKKSKMYPVDDKGKIKKGTTHDDYTGEMAKRTVINRAAKHIINTSDDGNIVKQYAVESDLNYAEADAAYEIEGNANQGEFIDAEYMEIMDEEIIDEETGEVLEQEIERRNDERTDSYHDESASSGGPDF